MKKEILELLEEYVRKVNGLKEEILRDFNVTNKKQLIERRLSLVNGDYSLESKNNYRFHGRGCNFSNSDFEIDWDFGYEEIWCGINIGLFLKYLTSNYQIENNVANYNKIENLCNNMVNRGILIKKYGLYYFAKDLVSVNEK